MFSSGKAKGIHHDLSDRSLVSSAITCRCTKLSSGGNQHEDIARGAFLEQERTTHRNVQVFASCLLVDHANPFLAVSSDGIVICDCCPRRVLEIKCPFKHRNNTLTAAAQEDNSFCLDKHTQLKRAIGILLRFSCKCLYIT